MSLITWPNTASGLSKGSLVRMMGVESQLGGEKKKEMEAQNVGYIQDLCSKDKGGGAREEIVKGGGGAREEIVKLRFSRMGWNYACREKERNGKD